VPLFWWKPIPINQATGGSHFQSIRQSVEKPISINQATLGFCLFFIHLFHIIHCRFIHWLLYSFVHIVIMCIIYYALYSSVCIIYYVHYLFMHTVQ